MQLHADHHVAHHEVKALPAAASTAERPSHTLAARETCMGPAALQVCMHH